MYRTQPWCAPAHVVNIERQVSLNDLPVGVIVGHITHYDYLVHFVITFLPAVWMSNLLGCGSRVLAEITKWHPPFGGSSQLCERVCVCVHAHVHVSVSV